MSVNSGHQGSFDQALDNNGVTEVTIRSKEMSPFDNYFTDMTYGFLGNYTYSSQGLQYLYGFFSRSITKQATFITVLGGNAHLLALKAKADEVRWLQGRVNYNLSNTNPAAASDHITAPNVGPKNSGDLSFGPAIVNRSDLGNPVVDGAMVQPNCIAVAPFGVDRLDEYVECGFIDRGLVDNVIEFGAVLFPFEADQGWDHRTNALAETLVNDMSKLMFFGETDGAANARGIQANLLRKRLAHSESLTCGFIAPDGVVGASDSAIRGMLSAPNLYLVNNSDGRIADLDVNQFINFVY